MSLDLRGTFPGGKLASTMSGLTTRPELRSLRASGTPRDLLFALLLGLVWFGANNLNVVRAHLQTPPGTQATWTPREIDVAQHLTWVNAMKDAAVIGNYHMPAATAGGLFCPLTWLLGQVARLGIDASLAYACAQMLIQVLGMYCILVCLRIFLIPRRHYLAVALLSLAAVSLRSPLNVWNALNGRGGPPLFAIVDGFFLPAPLTVALGTVSVFASLALVTRYVLRGHRADLYAAAAIAAVSGVCHPFEVFTIMAGTTLTLLAIRWPNRRSAVADSLVVCLPGALSVVPYVYFSITVPWMHRITQLNTEPLPDFVRLLAGFGIPAAFVLVNLVAGPKLRSPTDVVLQCWFAAVLLVVHTPKLPWAVHAADGFAFITALLAMRQLTQLSYLRNWISLHPRAAALAGAAVLGPALFAHGALRYMSFRDGLNPHSHFGLSAVAPQAETDLIRWFRRHGTREDVVIAPSPETSWMLATAPVHVVASHWLFSATFEAQRKLRDRLYSGDWSNESALEFLRRYGINYVVVPDGSKLHCLLDGYPKVAVFGSWTLYHLPENHMADALPDPDWTPFPAK